MTTIVSGIVGVGSNIQTSNTKKRLPADSSELTRQVRLAAGFRPYVNGGPFGWYLPKYRSFADAEMRQDYSLGFRFGPIFDAGTTRVFPPPEGSIATNPFIADFTGATGSVDAGPPAIYTFGDSLDYDVQSSTVYVRLDNIPTGSTNPGGTALTKIRNIVIDFTSAPNIQTGTFSGPAVPSAEGTYSITGWQYSFGVGGTPINAFEGVPFSFQMASTTPNITAIYVDLIV